MEHITPCYLRDVAAGREAATIAYEADVVTVVLASKPCAGDMWDELHQTLTDFEFLEAKCTHVAVTTEGSGATERKVYGGVYELQEDYRKALEVMPAP